MCVAFKRKGVVCDFGFEKDNERGKKQLVCDFAIAKESFEENKRERKQKFDFEF